MNALSVLSEFLSKNEAEPTVESETLLTTAYDLANKELSSSNYSIESVRLAHQVYGFLGDKGLNGRVEILKRYLHNDDNGSLADRFWANWRLVDDLALLKRYKEMIQEQRKFLLWTKANMEPEYWIEAMYDSTQAIGWVHECQEDEWFEIYHRSISNIEPSSSNRLQRILYVETAAGLLAFNLQKYDEALKEIARYKNVLSEDTSWSEFRKFSIRCVSYLLEAYKGKHEKDKYDEVADEAISDIESYFREYEKGIHKDADEICDMAHEIGSCLMWDQQYDKAISLFEYAIEHQGTGITHFFYAICIWATQKDRKKTLHHLQLAERKVKGNAGLRLRYIHLFLEQEEFSDIREDKQFLSVFRRE